MPTCFLLVDPDESIVAGTSRSLEGQGFEVLTALNESDRVRQLCESAPYVPVLEPDTNRALASKKED